MLPDQVVDSPVLVVFLVLVVSLVSWVASPGKQVASLASLYALVHVAHAAHAAHVAGVQVAVASLVAVVPAVALLSGRLAQLSPGSKIWRTTSATQSSPVSTEGLKCTHHVNTSACNMSKYSLHSIFIIYIYPYVYA